MDSDLLVYQYEVGMMQNFVYLIASKSTREAVIVDPAWDIDTLLEEADALDLKLTHALVTHYHQDHIGGEIFGLNIPGIESLMNRRDIQVIANKHEAQWIHKVTSLGPSDLTLVEGGDKLMLGELEITFLHTPGHTPGSQCFLVGDRLVAGDTLFLNGCGRTDLPGGDPEQLYDSLNGVLMKLPDDVILLPGHNYGGESASLGEVKRSNYALKMKSKAQWMGLHDR